MYMKLLEQTVRELKGEEIEDERRAAVNLHLDLRIDEAYVADMNQRLSIYRRLANASKAEAVDRILEELADRYGAPPASVDRLAEYARMRLLADGIGLERLDREGEVVVLKFRQDAKLDPAWLLNLIQSRSDLTLLPPAVLRLDLSKPAGPLPASGTSRPSAGPRRGRKEALQAPHDQAASWWTTRAAAGEVAPGFSREQAMADAVRAPRETELFERLGALLRQIQASL